MSEDILDQDYITFEELKFLPTKNDLIDQIARGEKQSGLCLPEQKLAEVQSLPYDELSSTLRVNDKVWLYYVTAAESGTMQKSFSIKVKELEVAEER